MENTPKNRYHKYAWPISTNTKLIDRWRLGLGIPGIVLAFIKAYEVLKEPSFRRTAEQCMGNIVPNPIILDLSLASGLAGLGETYLEAVRVFKDPCWLERVNWIANIFFYCYKEAKDNTGHWLTMVNDVTTAGLFSGNGGIIHFLMRYLHPENIRHPFFH